LPAKSKKLLSGAPACACRSAGEGRLSATAKEQGLDLQRLRRQVAFDRLLCRLFRQADSPWLLKGGYAMELRIRSARTTRDIDLDAAPYGGSRFPIGARMAGRRFVTFHLDVSAGDVLREPFELLEGRDWLGFAGIAKARLPAI
jgi:hypothetical protein